MRAPVFGKRVEQVDLLPLAGTPAAGQLEVLLLDVQHDDRLAVIEQVGNDDAHALARTGRRGKDHELLSAQADQVAVELADDQAGIRLLEHAVPGQVAGIGERSEERRGGKEGGSTGRVRWSPDT